MYSIKKFHELSVPISEASVSKEALLVIPDDMFVFMRERNGLLAMGSGIHFYDWEQTDFSLKRVNERIKHLSFSMGDKTSMGQDLFANQYCFDPSGKFWKMEIETGSFNLMSEDFEGFLSAILSDWEFESAFSIAEIWQKKNGPLELGFRFRLKPIIPFFMGGEFSTKNLTARSTFEILDYTSDIYVQTKDIEDGTKVKFITK
jgi:hypothetical protein